jgi:UDP-glucose 4-epimerase
MTTSVLITGGAGYVGGRIVRRLANREDILLRIGSRQREGAFPSWLKCGLPVLLDMMSSESLLLACSGVQSIIHLAALNEIDSSSNPEQALLVNGLGTLKLLQAAEQAGVSRFIYVSTAHVYGAPLAGVITERSLPRPVHPYAITHHIAEDFVLAAHDRKTLTGIVVRLSNSFGAPADATVNRWSLLINDLCRQAATSRVLTLYSSGLQRRDFIALEDVARAVEHFLFLAPALCGDGLFNLGGESSFKIIEIAEIIAARCQTVLGYTPEIKRPQSLLNEVSADLDFSIEKLKSSGFSLSGDLNEEIDATLRLCKEAFGGS